MENNQKMHPAGDDLQVRLKVKPRFKAGAESPASVNLEVDLSEDDSFSVVILVK
jgi:hypothetical protein